MLYETPAIRLEAPLIFAPRTRSETYLVEWMGFDLGEFVLHIIGVHCTDLFPRRSAQHFYNLYKLVDPRLPREQWLPQHQLGHHTASGPNI